MLYLCCFLVLLGIGTHFAFNKVSENYILLQKGNHAYQQKSYSQALEYYRQARSTGLSEPAARHYLEILLRLHHFVEAQILLNEWPYPQDLDVLRARAGMLDHFGKIQQAIDLYKANLELTRSDIYLTLHFSDLLIRVREFTAAKKELIALLSKDSKLLPAQALLIKIYTWNREFDKAIVLLNTRLEMDPADHEALILKARILSWTGKFTESEQLYLRLLGEGQ